MTLSLGQIEYNGFVFGPGTDWNYSAINGLRGLPQVNVADQPKQYQDGSWPTWSFMGERTVTITLDIVPSGVATLESDMAAMGADFIPTDNPASLPSLQFLLDSSWSQPRALTARLAKAAPVWDVGTSVGAAYQPFDIQFIAPDPLVYDATWTTATATGSGPFVASIINHGNYPMAPIITVTAIGSGTLTFNGTPRLTWTTNMGTTSPWTFNCQNHTVIDNSGTNSQYNSLAAAPSWRNMVLNPGSNTIEVSASGYGAGAGMTVQYASAWAWL